MGEGLQARPCVAGSTARVLGSGLEALTHQLGKDEVNLNGIRGQLSSS